MSVSSYYDYDQQSPLNVTTTPDTTLKYGPGAMRVKFTSTHHQQVTGILSYPNKNVRSVPVIILVHGLGDRKEVDYIEAGEAFFRNAGYAVLRLDLYNHGERKVSELDFSFQGSSRYRSRAIITQSVFDLRRSIDFIESREELDEDRIGFFGISLGGVIGTIFTGVDHRVKVPIIVLAGGQLNLMYGLHALNRANKDYLSIMDPIHYVKHISPRPLLMINAENDEIVPPITSKLLYQKAGKPKKIIWYPAKHRTLPIDKAYKEALVWFHDHL